MQPIIPRNQTPSEFLLCRMIEELAKEAFIFSRVPKQDTAGKASTSVRNAGRMTKEEMTRIFTWEDQA